MKRSSLVQKYIDVLQMYGYPKDNGFMPRAKLADMLLTVAENNGMVLFQEISGCHGEKLEWENENAQK